MADNFERSDEAFMSNDGVMDEVKYDDELDQVLEEIAEIKQTIKELHDMDGDGDVDEDDEEYEYLPSTNALKKIVAMCEELVNRSSVNERKLNTALASLKSNDRVASFDAMTNSARASEEYVASVLGNAAPAEKGLNVEVLRQLYDIKKLLGSSSEDAKKQNDQLFELYNLLNKVKYNVGQKKLSVVVKFNSVDELVKKLNEVENCDVTPIVDALNSLVFELRAQPLDRSTAQQIFDASQAGSALNIPSDKHNGVLLYFDELAKLVASDDRMGALATVIAIKNNIQNGRNAFENERIYTEILKNNIALINDKDIPHRKALQREQNKLIRKLTALEVGDLIDYPEISTNKPYSDASEKNAVGLYEQISALNNSGVVNNIDALSQAILSIKGDCNAILDRMDIRHTDDGATVVDGMPSLGEIVAQLDRLFDDIKNVVADSENNIMSSIVVIGEALARLGAGPISIDRSQEQAPIAPADASGLAARMDAIEQNQQQIMSVLNLLAANAGLPITGNEEDENFYNSPATLGDVVCLEDQITEFEKSVTAEIKQLRDQFFAVSMASVSDGETDNFESYNNIILNELYDISDKLEDMPAKPVVVEKNTEESEALSRELADIKADIAALDKGVDGDTVLKEIAKLQEVVATRPEPAPKAPKAPPKKRPAPETKPFSAPAQKKKKASALGKDLSISEILNRIGETDIIEIEEPEQ